MTQDAAHTLPLLLQDLKDLRKHIDDSVAPATKRVQPVRPKIRRGTTLVRLPVLSPEPPPHTDSDAPPPEGDEGS